MRVQHFLLSLSICLVLLIAETSAGLAPVRVGGLVANPNPLSPLKVHMGARSLWSDGGYSHEVMAQAASKAGYDAIFFTDNALQFNVAGRLADPGFENVSASGTLYKWQNGTSGPLNSTQASVDIFTLPPYSLSSDYYSARQRVLSGNHSLHLSDVSTSTRFSTAGYSFVRDIFPTSYEFNSTPFPPSRLLLSSGVTLSVNAFIDSLGYADTPNLRGPTNFTDNGWFYLRFYLRTDAHGSPTSGLKLVVTLIYSDHPIDDYFRRIRSGLNETNTKYIYEPTPIRRQWINLRVNVTDLTARLWNESIANDWRLGNFEIGTRSINNAVMSVYIDNVYLDTSHSNPLEYFTQTIHAQLSNATCKIYSGYSVDVPNQPSPYIIGTDYIDSNITYKLSDPEVWELLNTVVSAHGGLLALGPMNSAAYVDYLVSNNGFAVRAMDGSSWPSVNTAIQIMQNTGNALSFVATREAVGPDDFDSNRTWSVRVFADNDSLNAILNALEDGRDYATTSNYAGNFSANYHGFPIGRSPIYIPFVDNASLNVIFGGLAPGYLRIYRNGGEGLRLDHNGSYSKELSFPVIGKRDYWILTVTGTNDTLSIVAGPYLFVHASMLPQGALQLDNPNWSLKSSQWTASMMEQRLQLVVSGPSGTNSTLRLYSPSYEVPQSITVGKATIPAGEAYDGASRTFLVPLHSTGGNVTILFNFDIPFTVYIYSVGLSVGILYLLVLVPFAIAAIYAIVYRTTRRR